MLYQQIRQFSTLKHSRIGIIGLGNVGHAITTNLLKKGYNVAGVLDIDREKIKQMEVPGFEHPAAVAQKCNIIITALPTPAEVKEVIEDSPNNLLSALRKDSIWIDHSTTDYEQTLRFSKKLETLDAQSLEAPVTGGITLLKQGQMTCFVGGNKTTYDYVLPLLKESCQNVLYMGKIGSATITKVISNMLAGAHCVLMGEALMMAKRSGVDLKAFFNGIRLSAGNSYVFETEGPLIFNQTYDPDFPIRLHCKDFALGYDIARRFKTPMPVHALVEQIYNQAQHAYGDDVGSSSPPRLLEDSLKTSLQIPGYENWTYSVKQIEGSLAVLHRDKNIPNAAEVD